MPLAELPLTSLIRYYFGVLQWIIAKLGWFFLKTMNVSGAEAVVAAASPFIGQGESACMVKPYVNQMTSSEIHQASRCPWTPNI